jgi:hypothetical protein
MIMGSSNTISFHFLPFLIEAIPFFIPNVTLKFKLLIPYYLRLVEGTKARGRKRAA